MATQVDDTSSEVSAVMVGNAFVTQFYHILHESPELVHKFFQDSSTMSRPGSDGVPKIATTMKGIDDLILSLECKDYKAEILTADAQASHKDGVIVLVTGCLTGKDNVRRKFTESFFLAPQDKGYFVLNDAFRFVEERKMSHAPSVEGKEPSESAPAETLSAAQDADVTQASTDEITTEVAIEKQEETVDVPINVEKSTVAKVADPQTPIQAEQSVQPVVEPSSNGHVDTPKKSYASLLKGMKEGAPTTLANVPTTSAKPTSSANSAKPVAPNVAQQAVPVKQQSRPDALPATAESSATNGRNANGGVNNLTEEKGHSVYIGDLPWDATTELVEQEFKRFGPIKHNGIQVRSNKGYCFGFVEFEDANGKAKAIEAASIRIRGKEAFIQEKKTSTRVVNGVSMYPSGRGGGFRNDGFRGRGNFSNGRGGGGYARNDYKQQRNGDVPPRSSSRNGGDRGYHHGVYQNGGGGGGRGGGRQGAPIPK